VTARTLLVGRRLPDLEREAFDRVAPDGATHPSQILYLTGSGHLFDRSRERWTEHAPATALRTQSLDNFVADCFERDQYAGEETHVGRALLLRLVELGVETVETESNPLGATDRLQSPGFTREVEDLFTDLEFAGLLSPSEMHGAIDELGLGDRADDVRELAEAVIDTRATELDGELPQTFQTERIAHVAHETDLEALYPSVEAVVVGPLDQYDELYVELLAAVAETWPTTAILPRHTTDPERDADGTHEKESTPPQGVDRALDRPLAVYDRLGFDRERIDTPPADDPTATFAASLYRHPTDAPTTADESTLTQARQAADDIDYCEPADTQLELRYVARDVRERLADGTDADQIGVVLPSGTAYGDRLDELFEQYGIPHNRTADHQLTETHHGELVAGLCDLAAEPRTAETVLDVVTNPLVGLDDSESDLGNFDHRELARTADRVTATQLSAVREHLDTETDDVIQSLLENVEELDETRLQNLPDALDSLLRDLGVPEPTEDDEPDFPSAFASREERASETLDETVETLRLTADAADESIGTTTDRLERALHGVTVRGSGGSRDGSVTVCELGEAAPYEFAYTYCLGLTTDHLPSPTERSTFVRPIYDRHPGLSDDDPVAETRYHLAGNLTSAGKTLLSVPQHDADGDSLVEADFVTELRRLVDLDDLAVDLDEPRPGTAEDVQREIGRGIATAGGGDGGTADRIVGDAESAESLTAPQADRLRAGVACAEARADTKFTPYDGRLTAETVELVRPADDREPYSPSRIERYANCGFKYYARHVLGIETPDEIGREPNYADRGTYLHDVLEAYYKSLQSWEGESVSAAGDAGASDAERARRLLDIALDHLDSAFGDHEETPFQSSWLRKVLAGLGDPDENPYFRATPGGAGDEDDSPADGLFARFLDNEATEIGKTTARPTWFEGRVGRPDEDGTHLSDDAATVETPTGEVTLRGIIDRVDTVSERDPTGLVVRDYKTGSVPSERETLGGLAFQLPLYALMAEDALDATETLGGTYYRVAPPGTVNSRSGLITSQEQAAYHGSEDPGTPMLRHSYPHFETHEAFRRFLDETVPARLGKIAEGIEQGRFQPTILDPDDAGCEYCDYASVCDVRSHRRQDVIDHVEASEDESADSEAYLPPLVRDIDLADVVEVN
jgi:ATP-dependent helicase/nuclease subunit B